MYEVDQHLDLTFGQLLAKWQHSVAAVGDLLIDLLLAAFFEVASAEAGDDFTVVERFTVAFGAVADRTVLTKQRSLVGFVVCDHVFFGFRIETSCNKKRCEDKENKGLDMEHKGRVSRIAATNAKLKQSLLSRHV